MSGAAALLIALSLAGCDPVEEGDESPPRIVRLVASGGRSAPVVAERPAEIGTDGVARWELPARDSSAAGIPGEHLELRVELSKPMDGTTIQDPAAGDCAPAAGIGVALDGAPLAGAALCYDPSSPLSGAGAAIVVRPPAQPATDEQPARLPPGGYRVTGTVRDQQGRSLSVNALFRVAPP